MALTVPVAGATMWTLLQHNARQHPEDRNDMTPAVLIGAALSAAITLPLALPLSASAHDIGLLSLLGVVQLAVPCVLAVAAGKVLKAPEASLLGLLEILFGVLWTWLGSSESPRRRCWAAAPWCCRPWRPTRPGHWAVGADPGRPGRGLWRAQSCCHDTPPSLRLSLA